MRLAQDLKREDLMLRLKTLRISVRGKSMTLAEAIETAASAAALRDQIERLDKAASE